MTARWAFAPVCGFDFWRVIVTSPEVLIFLFFMITDPKTVPAGRVGRVLFGVLVAVASTLLMAPQTDEFGTKVALLGGLVVVCACVRSSTGSLPRRSAPTGSAASPLGRHRRRADRRRAPSSGVGLVVLGVGVVAAGVVAGTRRVAWSPEADDVLGRVPHDVDPATFPTITVEQDVSTGTTRSPEPGARRSSSRSPRTSSWRTRPLLRADATILEAVDHGDRLDEMQARLDEAEATGTTVVERYEIDDVNVTLLVPFGRQDGLSLGLESSGTVTEETYDAGGQLQATDVRAVRHDVRHAPERPVTAGSTSPCCP